MIIRSMTADFGRLEGETLELEPGLNVIARPNESGKSTWCAFIRAMLYGIDTSERVKGGFLPDKLRYAPWSGAPMSGTMELEYAGREITLTRWTKSASSPMREFRAVYSGTAEPVPGLTGASAGEALIGAGREIFRRSAFIGRGEAAVTGSAELERRIASGSLDRRGGDQLHRGAQPPAGLAEPPPEQPPHVARCPSEAELRAQGSCWSTSASPPAAARGSAGSWSSWRARPGPRRSARRRSAGACVKPRARPWRRPGRTCSGLRRRSRPRWRSGRGARPQKAPRPLRAWSRTKPSLRPKRQLRRPGSSALRRAPASRARRHTYSRRSALWLSAWAS
ncbi:MAG: ATP-binding protein [Lachnospiraceae bacterium]